MRYFHKLKNQFHMPTINTDKLATLISEEVRRSRSLRHPPSPRVACTGSQSHVQPSVFARQGNVRWTALNRVLWSFRGADVVGSSGVAPGFRRREEGWWQGAGA
jgi:hypothetical protein